MAAHLLQPRARNLTVMGAAQYFLHLFNGDIVLGTKLLAEAAREYLHRIAKPLANDAHLMQMSVDPQVLRYSLIQFIQQLPQVGTGKFEQRRRAKFRRAQAAQHTGTQLIQSSYLRQLKHHVLLC